MEVLRPIHTRDQYMRVSKSHSPHRTEPAPRHPPANRTRMIGSVGFHTPRLDDVLPAGTDADRIRYVRCHTPIAHIRLAHLRPTLTPGRRFVAALPTAAHPRGPCRVMRPASIRRDVRGNESWVEGRRGLLTRVEGMSIKRFRWVYSPVVRGDFGSMPMWCGSVGYAASFGHHG